jgi:hypothetical protein
VWLTCTDTTTGKTGAAEAVVTIGPRPIAIAVQASRYMKEQGWVFYALEKKTNEVRVKIVEGTQKGARYDYRIAWGDGTESEWLNTTANYWLRVHNYGSAPRTCYLEARVRNRHTGKEDAKTVRVEVVDAATFAAIQGVLAVNR